MIKILNLKFVILLEYRISKYKNIFAKGYVSNLFKEVFVIKKVKRTVPQIYVISDLKREELVGKFFQKIIAKNKSKRVQS